jgi:hypothetical protein
MPRPRKYATDAEKSAAYRMRKRLKEESSGPTLDALARAIHRIYKKRAAAGVGEAEHMVGKSPFETLIRVVLYDVLFERHMKDGEMNEFPGWDQMIQPLDISGENGTSYMVSRVKSPTGVMIYLPSEAEFFGGEELEEEESGG